MAQKVKARNVITGWPRGKTTLRDNTPRLYEYREFVWTWEYQKAQEEMLDRHRSEYRRPTPAWLFRKIMQRGGMAIATSGETTDTITLGEYTGPWEFAPKSATEKLEEKIEENVKKNFLYTPMSWWTID